MTIFVFIKCCKQSSSQDAIQWKVMQAEKDKHAMLYLFFINKLRPSTLGIAYSCTHFPYLPFIHFKNFTPTEQSKIKFDDIKPLTLIATNWVVTCMIV